MYDYEIDDYELDFCELYNDFEFVMKHNLINGYFIPTKPRFEFHRGFDAYYYYVSKDTKLVIDFNERLITLDCDDGKLEILAEPGKATFYNEIGHPEWSTNAHLKPVITKVVNFLQEIKTKKLRQEKIKSKEKQEKIKEIESNKLYMQAESANKTKFNL